MLAFGAICASCAQAQVVTVPEGTVVRLRLTETLSSKHSKNRDSVHFDVLDDVLVDGKVIIAQGAMARGEITDARGNRMMGRAGHIELAGRYVTAADGSHISISGDRRVKGSNAAGIVTTGVVVTTVLFFPAAPLWLLKHGHDTEIAQGTAFTFYTTDAAPVGLAEGEVEPLPRAAAVVPIPSNGEHVIEGYSLSGQGAEGSMTNDPDATLGDAARAVRAKHAIPGTRKQ